MLGFKDQFKGYLVCNTLMTTTGIILVISLYLNNLINIIIFIIHMIFIGLSLLLFLSTTAVYKLKMCIHNKIYENFYKYTQLGLAIFLVLTIVTWCYIYSINGSKIYVYIGVLIYDIINTILNILYIMVSPPFQETTNNADVVSA